MTSIPERIALTLTLLDRVSVLYHETFVKKLLEDFHASQPADAKMLPASLEYFADYLLKTEHADRQDLIDLIRVAHKSWQVSKGPSPDPSQELIFEENPALDSIFLQANHAWVHSEAPIYSLWQAAGKRLKEGELSETFIPNQAESLLLYKGPSGELNCVSIASPFLALIERLSQGQSLMEALEGMSWHEAEVEKQFRKLLNILQSSFALITKS